MRGPEPGDAAGGQAIGDEMQKIADQQADERHAQPLRHIEAGYDAGERVAEVACGAIRARPFQRQADATLRAVDNRGDHHQPDDAVEESAVPRSVLDDFADRAKFLAGVLRALSISGVSAPSAAKP